MAKLTAFLPALFLTSMASGAAAADATQPARFLYAWSGDQDEKDSDFLAVIDVDRHSPNYGKVVATAPIGVKATMPHHIEYETPPGTNLFANGWKSGHSFVIDLADP